jgi:hypothetical protein
MQSLSGQTGRTAQESEYHESAHGYHPRAGSLLYDIKGFTFTANSRSFIQERRLMKSSGSKLALGAGLIAVGVAIAAAGIYIGDTDDAPGAALIGILIMIAAIVLGVKTARRKT